MPLTAAEASAKLEKVLADSDSLARSAKATFTQFDRDGSGTLCFAEVSALLEKLCSNLQLPPIDQNTLQKVLLRYDTQESDSSLDLQEFTKLYRDLLALVRDKYYPRRTLIVRRSFFVGRRRLRQDVITDYFEFIKQLGAGSFGEAHLVREKSSRQERVIKTINKQQAALPIEQIDAEIDFLKHLDHPNIIKVFDVYEDFNNVYIVQELCGGGELMDRVVALHKSGKRFSERSVAEVMKRLLEALAYCHDKKIAHKDLKPENIMFLGKEDTSPLKVIDFGVAEMFSRIDETSRRAAGTALYMAPEVFRMRVGLKCDLWSAGCIMYLLLSGKLPFIGRTLKEIQAKVTLTEPKYESDLAGVSQEGIALLKSLLSKNPLTRPSCKAALTHSWFSNASEDHEVFTPDITSNLQRYMRQSQIKNALVNMMIHQMNVSAPQIQQLANLFRTLDVDGNGTLTQAELTSGLENAGWKPWDVNRIIAALDMDSSGQIDYTEFLSACYSFRESELNLVWSAFAKLDTDGDGKITTDEFVEVILGGGAHIVKSGDTSEIIRSIDKNQDGFVEWDEFLKFIRGA